MMNMTTWICQELYTDNHHHYQWRKEFVREKKTTTIAATAVVVAACHVLIIIMINEWSKPIQINTWPRQTINIIKEKKTKIIKDKGEQQQQKWKDHEIEQIVCVSSVCCDFNFLCNIVCVENIKRDVQVKKKRKKKIFLR